MRAVFRSAVSAVVLVGIAAAAVWWSSHKNGAETKGVEDGGFLRMELKLAEPKAQVMRKAAFLLSVKAPSGEPAAGAEAELRIFMPYMFCGEFTADFAEIAPGVYRAEAVPVMRGTWRAEAVVRWNGGTTKTKAQFEVQ